MTKRAKRGELPLDYRAQQAVDELKAGMAAAESVRGPLAAMDAFVDLDRTGYVSDGHLHFDFEDEDDVWEPWPAREITPGMRADLARLLDAARAAVAILPEVFSALDEATQHAENALQAEANLRRDLAKAEARIEAQDLVIAAYKDALAKLRIRQDAVAARRPPGPPAGAVGSARWRSVAHP